MFWPPSERTVGEAYLRDDYDIEGDLAAAAGLADLLISRFSSPQTLLRLALLMRTLPRDDHVIEMEPAGTGAGGLTPSGDTHSKERDAEVIRYHYDVGNDFYALWLDARMVYSCAYFPEGTEDLDAAQTAKLEHICRKLRLQPGERLLDIGCGWGGLILYAAQHYGVLATGITLSEAQATLARERIRAAGLEARVQVQVRDYRDLAGERFDKIASVGMFEHVGRAHLQQYVAQVYTLLKPGGLFLNHGIVIAEKTVSPSPLERLAGLIWREKTFMQQYVFPDGELVYTHEVLAHAERLGFETRDIESLREHYALTLQHWVRRLEARHAAVVASVGETGYRIWRFYMSGCVWAFNTGRIGLSQMLFSKPDARGRSGLPLSRADLYRSSSDDQ
ncbi:cyclopropane-fatty-acyl-phospholipid synthase [Deinococcus ruber]|uniref:Cyclopropane-fatty-acyl-phospholipid synthase n=2 Tax=Deinococcus ruber TaxID=1848197 RepID=A0A918CHE7_9DEIO|nr:cyclopropane-fatty-acyl-phospholipid synthase [Deinococcus ruber]